MSKNVDLHSFIKSFKDKSLDSAFHSYSLCLSFSMARLLYVCLKISFISQLFIFFTFFY
jgi:hypothetical protein